MIDLRKIKHLKLDEECTGASPKYWLEIYGERYLFKANYMGPEPVTKTNFGEALYSRLSKKLGFNCVDANLAVGVMNGQLVEGVLVKSFFRPDDVDSMHVNQLSSICMKNGIHDLFENTAETHIKEAQFFAKTFDKNIDMRQVCLDLRKLAIVDYFLGQGDRHTENIDFIFDKEGGMRVAPYFDNGHCLGLRIPYFSVMRMCEEMDNGTRPKEDMGDRSCYTLSDHTDDPPFVKNHKEIYTIFDMAKVCTHSPELKKLVINMLNLDIVDELTQLEKESGLELGEHYKQLANCIYTTRCEKFKSMVNMRDFQSKNNRATYGLNKMLITDMKDPDSNKGGKSR